MMVVLFGTVHEPIYKGGLCTGRERVRTVSEKMLKAQADEYIAYLKTQGCEVELFTKPLRERKRRK